MRHLPRVVWILAGGRFANACASFVPFFLLLYLTGPRGLPVPTAGLISGAVGTGVIAGSFTGGWFSDRFGHRGVMLAASAVGGVSLLAVPWLPTAILALVMPLGSYGSGTAGVAQNALVARAVAAHERRTAIALGRSAFNAGCVIGPPLGALLASHSYTWLFLVESTMTLAFAALAARILPRHRPGPASRAHAPGLWRTVRADRPLAWLLLAVLTVDVVYRQLYSTLPVYLRDNGHPVGLYAGLIALGSGVILCLELPVALALRRRSALGVIATGYGLVGVGFGLFGLGTAAALMVGAMLVVTAGEILYKTTATAHVADRAPPHLLARYQGLYTGMSISGVVLAPPIGTALYGAAPHLLWPTCAAAAAVAALVAWRSRPGGPRSYPHATVTTATPEPARPSGGHAVPQGEGWERV